MTSLFSSYEESFNDGVAEVRSVMVRLHDGLRLQEEHTADVRRLYTPPPITGPSSRTAQVQSIMQGIFSIRDYVNSMSYESHDLEDHLQAAATAKVEEHRRTLAALEREVTELRQRCTAADRKDLLTFHNTGDGGGGFINEPADAETQQHRMMSLRTTEKLQSGTNTLRRAEALLNQGNEMGHATLTTLGAQTEQMQSIAGTTLDVDAEISTARGIIQGMQRTALKHKLVLISVIGVLVLMLIYVLYAKIHG